MVWPDGHTRTHTQLIEISITGLAPHHNPHQFINEMFSSPRTPDLLSKRICRTRFCVVPCLTGKQPTPHHASGSPRFPWCGIADGEAALTLTRKEKDDDFTLSSYSCSKCPFILGYHQIVDYPYHYHTYIVQLMSSMWQQTVSFSFWLLNRPLLQLKQSSRSKAEVRSPLVETNMGLHAPHQHRDKQTAA